MYCIRITCDKCQGTRERPGRFQSRAPVNNYPSAHLPLVSRYTCSFASESALHHVETRNRHASPLRDSATRHLGRRGTRPEAVPRVLRPAARRLHAQVHVCEAGRSLCALCSRTASLPAAVVPVRCVTA